MCVSDFFAAEMPAATQQERAQAVAGKVGVKAGTVQKYFQLDRYPTPKTLDEFCRAWPALDVHAWRQEYLKARQKRGRHDCRAGWCRA